MAMEIQDAKGDVKYKGDPQTSSFFNALGGNVIPASAAAFLGADQPPGKYTMKVTVTDLNTKDSKTLVREFELLNKEFGLILVYGTLDEQGQVQAPPVGSPGQYMYLRCHAVGFARSKEGNQPKITFEYRILDENNKPTLEKPFKFTAGEGIDSKESALPATFNVMYNRPGKFVVEITAKDELAGKTFKVSYPIQVIDSK
jgi:hypothetical protein